jgi:hypothetical protein
MNSSTGDFSIPGTRPPKDRPESAVDLAGAKPEKSGRGFADAMDDALRRQPEVSRTARAAARGHGEAVSASSARGKVVRLPKPDAARENDSAGPSGVGTSAQSERVEEAQRGKEEKGQAGDASVASAPTAPAEATKDVAAEPKSQTVPQNIVAFPTPSVIVPFPTEAARSGGEARAASAPGSQAAGDSVAGSATNAAASSASGHGRQLPATTAGPAQSLLEAKSPDAGPTDATPPGLKPVEQPAPASNIHPVDFKQAAAAKPTAEQQSGSIITVAFRSAGETRKARAAARREQAAPTPLPGESGRAEKTARLTTPGAVVTEAGATSATSPKAAASAGSPAMPGTSAVLEEPAGTSTAEQASRMDSTTNSEQPNASTGREASALDESSVTASPSSALSQSDGDAMDFSARSLLATEWQTGRPVSSSDRSAPESVGEAPSTDAAAMVERISGLVSREAGLVRQHGSDSMAVVLRPDADTELYVHFARRDGQIEATVRCERGDAHLLGAWWGQLQESLAQQKVRLGPLQESPSNPSHFNLSAGAHSSADGGEHRSPRQTPHDPQSMDEWPVPASSSSSDSVHRRGRGGSRHRRLTTSRPGWETWA